MRSLLPLTLLAGLALAAPAAAVAAPRIAYESFSGVSTVKSDGSGHKLLVKHADAPSWSPDHGRVAYVLKNAIWTARADGSDRRRVIALGNGLPFDPAWSPDGKRIAYQRITEVPRPGADDGEVNEVHAVFTVRTNGTGTRMVHAGESPAWTPSGNHIVLTQTRRTSSGAFASTLGIVRPDGTGYRRLRTSDSYISDLAVQPSGRRIAYIQALGTTAIGVFDRSTERNTLFVKSDRTALMDIAWTPGGSRIAWLQHRISRKAGPSPATRLYTARPDGSGQRAQFSFARGIESPDAFDW
jgi:Tol biopolymer transport system component